ncbi:MAG: 2-amino-4-hydroxy-6-hydroxymethyldihydropteridine diphosphokinase [Planctomycetales bacterium 4572_13]|nr:MAG: 2-amino-4-hydroxy-6-hydroxymethyldihydropteridine diphosphokinase [Planctomycetales bacterium 4572_13]
MTKHTAYIGLGSNLGEMHKNIQNAISDMGAFAGVRSIELSSFYKTKPLTCRVGYAHAETEQPTFLNAVAKIKTTLSCQVLFEGLQEIERGLGRQRNEPWGPRTIDLDLLLYDDAVINEPDLKVPHPQMHLRSFVLKGMCELAGDIVHPQIGCTMRELAGRLNGADFFTDPENPQLISIAGNIGIGKTTLAAGLAQRLNAKFISEKYDDNPFLPQVYAGKTELALDSELFFLSSSASQLRGDRLFAPRCYVSDYVFDKALIYASNWLGESDLEVYRKHYESVNEGVAPPVLVIYLHDTVQNCLNRIHKRNRPYEQRIESSFLEHLADGYDWLYTGYENCPVIRLAPEQCWDTEQVDQIAEEIKHYLAEVSE